MRPKTKTISRRGAKTSKTKTKKRALLCPISLKPFQAEFSKRIPSNQLVATNKTRKKEFVKELMAKFAPHSVKPEDNFYDYINYLWLKNVSLKKQQQYIVQVDDFRLTQDKVYRQLNDIILDFVKHDKSKMATNMGKLYDSVVHMNNAADSRQRAQDAVHQIDELLNKHNAWKMLAFINSDEMTANDAPFVWATNPDNKQPDVFRCYITPHVFSIVDLSIYYDDGKEISYKNKYRKRFHTYCQNIFDTCLGKGQHSFNPQDIFDVEVEIFTSLGCIDVTKKKEESYNKVFASEALSKYGFDWNTFAAELGYVSPPAFFITTSLNCLKCGADLLTANWETPKWRTYWVWILLKKIARVTRHWEKITYEFYGSFERGQQGINASDAVSASLYMSIPYNSFLTQKYAEKYENPQAIEYVKTLCGDLKIVYRRILQRNRWMSAAAKKTALKKLDHFHFVIGKPEHLQADPDLQYGDSLFENMHIIMKCRHEQFIKLEGKPYIDIPMMDWTQYPVKMSGTQAYIVNASYTPSKNSIYINLGYIQKPFLDMDERGIEYNLAHIGFTVAHEMSHGFDDFGSQYDERGVLHDWWSAADKKKFKHIQEDVTKQYELVARRDGIKYDASIGIGENMADISGMAICSEYLRDFQENNQDLVPIRYLSFEAFFTYYAFQQKQKVGKRALAAQLKTNPHPLDKYRCNVPLSRSDIFRAMYNIKKGDGMWWHNTDAVW